MDDRLGNNPEQTPEAVRAELSLPIGVKPFRVRTQEAWSAFLDGEGELRALLDEKDRAAVGDALVQRCAELLAPAFANPAFELGRRDGKYELILSPEGNRARLFQLAYFQKRAPRELLEKWNILVGRTRSGNFRLQMEGQDVALEDVRVWAEKAGNSGAALKLYCEKLVPLMKEDEGAVYNIIYILLDQALGELAAMRYVDALDVLPAPAEGESITLDALAAFIETEVDPEGWAQADDPEVACLRYTAYRGEPAQAEDRPLRADVFAGATCCLPILNAWFRGDDYYMDRLHADGAVPGFFYYPLDGVDKNDVLDLRDRLEGAIGEKAGEDAVTFTGGATGTDLGYLDFIAWDLKAVLDAAVAVFAAEAVAWAGFHTFRFNADGVGLKEGK